MGFGKLQFTLIYSSTVRRTHWINWEFFVLILNTFPLFLSQCKLLSHFNGILEGIGAPQDNVIHSRIIQDDSNWDGVWTLLFKLPGSCSSSPGAEITKSWHFLQYPYWTCSGVAAICSLFLCVDYLHHLWAVIFPGKMLRKEPCLSICPSSQTVDAFSLLGSVLDFPVSVFITLNFTASLCFADFLPSFHIENDWLLSVKIIEVLSTILIWRMLLGRQHTEVRG